MLGILQVNEQKGKNKILSREIYIENIKFYEVIAELKYDKKNLFSKIIIDKAVRLFLKQKVSKICAKNEYFDFLYKHNLENISHFDIFYAKRFEILKMIDKKTIFVHSKNRDISDMVDFLAKRYDDIFLDVSINEQRIKQQFLTKFGVSVADFNAKYKQKEGIYCCFDKPSSFLYGEIIVNFSQKKFPIACIDDIECEIDFYKGNTDITALCSALVNVNIKTEKNIYIKKIIINT
ncbi:MAG: hypothetical protein R3Y09_04815 [Clostridia bacterium]